MKSRKIFGYIKVEIEFQIDMDYIHVIHTIQLFQLNLADRTGTGSAGI
jgi:hypothetical protein